MLRFSFSPTDHHAAYLASLLRVAASCPLAGENVAGLKLALGSEDPRSPQESERKKEFPGFSWQGDGQAQISWAGIHAFFHRLFENCTESQTLARESECCSLPATINRWFGSLEDQIAAFGARSGLPVVRLTRWPQGARFAACLTHDVDQIYDRELFRVLADVNHLRKVWTGREAGNTFACLRRMGRSLLRPKHHRAEFQTIRKLEQHHGWRSTFFLLEDRYWRRYGGRYKFADRPVRQICEDLLSDNCELAIHGSYYEYSDSGWYRQTAESFLSVFNFAPAGVRNHFLRFSLPETWAAQEQADLRYDSTWGHNHLPGPRGGLALPFFGFDPVLKKQLNVLELPLTIMDGTLLRHLDLDARAAFDTARSVIVDARDHEGLVTLLWHNNFFAEPEYANWEEVYGRLLDLLASEEAIVLTAKEIDQWWRARAATLFETTDWRAGSWSGTLQVPSAVEGITLEVVNSSGEVHISTDGAPADQVVRSGRRAVIFPRLTPHDFVRISIRTDS